MTFLGPLLLTALSCVHAGAPPRPLPTMAEKPFGVLLLGEGGSRDWSQAVETIRAELSPKFPVEFAPGLAYAKSIQKGVEALEARKVKKIVAVPLFVSSFSEVMDQNRYLLGIREKPSKEFLGAPHSHDMALGNPPRIKSKVPLILTRALDDDPRLVEILAARAKAQSRDPAREAILLVGQGPGSKQDNKDWLAVTGALAEKVRRKGGFKSARTASLRPNLSQEDRQKEAEALRKTAKDMSRNASVIVVPLGLAPGGIASRLPKILDGLFFKFDGKTVLPDPLVARWVEDSARAGAKLPDMRVYKNAVAKGIPPPPPIGKQAPGGYQ